MTDDSWHNVRISHATDTSFSVDDDKFSLLCVRTINLRLRTISCAVWLVVVYLFTFAVASVSVCLVSRWRHACCLTHFVLCSVLSVYVRPALLCFFEPQNFFFSFSNECVCLRTISTTTTTMKHNCTNDTTDSDNIFKWVGFAISHHYFGCRSPHIWFVLKSR